MGRCGVTYVAEVRLAGDRAASVGEFRRFVEACLAGLPAAVVADGSLVASELSTNTAHTRSVLPGGTYTGRVEVSAVDVLICVTDQGSDTTTPDVRADPGPRATAGRGLFICSKLGRLTTEPAAGGGCRVCVRIPILGRSPGSGATDPAARHSHTSAGRQSRATRVWALITAHAAGGAVSVRQVCAACVSAVGVDGAAVWVATDLDHRALLHATDKVARVLDEVDFTLGEGPCAQAWSGRAMVLAPDLAAPESAARWPIFTPAAVAAGVGAIFAFPLQVGAIRVGVLGLYRVSAGPLSEEELADALALSFAAFTLVCDQTARQTGSPVGPAAGASSASEQAARSEQATWPFDGLGEGKAEVYQATGMVAVQLDTTLDEALLRLRAHAFTLGVGVTEVARQVVDRKLHFNPHDE